MQSMSLDRSSSALRRLVLLLSLSSGQGFGAVSGKRTVKQENRECETRSDGEPEARDRPQTRLENEAWKLELQETPRLTEPP